MIGLGSGSFWTIIRGMIIFGWGRRMTKDHGPGQGILCPNCRNNTRFHLIVRRTWFTLFFIPVIPYETMYMEICPICSRGQQVTKDQFQAALADRQNNANLVIYGPQGQGTQSIPAPPVIPPQGANTPPSQNP